MKIGRVSSLRVFKFTQIKGRYLNIHYKLPHHSTQAKMRPVHFAIGFLCLSPLMLIKGSAGITYTEMAVAFFLIIILLISFSYQMLTHQGRLRIIKLDMSILLLFVFFAIDLIKVFNEEMSLVNWLHWRKFFLFLIYFPVRNEVRSDKHIKFILAIIIFVGIINGLIDIGHIYSSGSSIAAITVERKIKSVNSLWIGILLIGMARFVLNIKGKRLTKLLFIGTLSVCLVSSLSFARRTSLILISIAAVISTWFNIKHAKRTTLKLIFLIGLLLTVLVTSLGLFERYKVRFEEDMLRRAYASRIVRYYEAWNEFLRNPLLGTSKPTDFYFYDFRTKTYLYGSVHSLYLYILRNGGVIGMLFFVYFVYSVFSLFYKVLKSNNAKNSILQMCNEAAFVTVICMFLSGFTSTRMLMSESWLLLGILLGLVRSSYRIQHECIRYCPASFTKCLT